MDIQCGIAIVGGGPAGLSAAVAAAKAGVDSIMVIERKRAWGVPVQCAGYVPRMLGREVDFDKTAIRQRLKTLDFYMDDECAKRIAAPGYVLHRHLLEAQMARTAESLGVQCVQPARVVEVTEKALVVEREGERFHLHANVVIGADGPNSMVRAAMGLGLPEMAIGMEYELPLTGPQEDAQVHFREDYGAGYAWIFPHGNTAGVGLALDDAGNGRMRRLLDEFVCQNKSRGLLAKDMDKPLAVVSGPIPVGGVVSATVCGNRMLAGDAAGQTNPLTGAGILSAIVCGRMAGCAAASAIEKDDLKLLETYESEWRDFLGGMLGRMLKGRTKMAGAKGRAFREATQRAWRLL